MSISYYEKLKDPRWQKKRLEILEAADWTCKFCGSKEDTLHVHHGYYRKGADPWDYDDKALHALCEECHPQIQKTLGILHAKIGALHPRVLDQFTDAICALEGNGEGNKVLEFLCRAVADIWLREETPAADTRTPAQFRKWLIAELFETSVLKAFQNGLHHPGGKP